MDSTKIPKVDFYKKKGSDIEFEIFPLQNLLARKNRLPHPISLPHRVQFHNIVYITSGEGFHYVDFKPYTLRAGSLMFIAQGQVRSFDDRTGLEGYIILFTTNYLKENLIHTDLVPFYRLYNTHRYDPVFQPDDTEAESFPPLLEQLEREYHHPNAISKKDILRLLLKALLLKIERITQTRLTTYQKNTEWFVHFGKFREHLQTNHARTRSVKDYAGMLNISTKHLNTICKAVSGTTAKQCIDDFLILEIKRILATTNDPVQAIAYDSGFDEPTNFVKYFKKHTGNSPSEFRNTFKK